MCPQGLLADRAMPLLVAMQRLPGIHRLLAGLADSARQALQGTRELSEQLDGVLGPLGPVSSARPPEGLWALPQGREGEGEGEGQGRN